MLGNSSFSQTGATPTNPIGSINTFLNKQFGVPLPKPPAPAPMQGPPAPNMSIVPQGSTPGLLPGVNSSTQQKKTTVDAAGNTTTIHPPTSNPSVLAQQQMLNKTYGAGLVEDGIAGPKTSAAIAKYLTGGGGAGTVSPTPTSTPVNTGTRPPTTPPVNTPPPLTVGGQAGNVLQAGQLTPTENLALNDPEVDKANEALIKFKKDTARQLGAISTEPIPLEFQQGRKQVVSNIAAAELGALETGVQNALTKRAQTIGLAGSQAGRALSGAQGVLGAVAPAFPSYGSQVIQPGLLGTTGGGGTGGGLQDAVANVVARLTNGTMSYNDAVAALSGYGQGGLNALQNALPPGFNVAQSNTLAGQQGQIKPAYDFAKAALTRLQDTVKRLGFGQGTNVPGVNAIGDWFSRTFGVNSQQTREYSQAVAEARNAYAQLLAASRGGTPTEYGNQATAAIPDNATPNDIAAALASLESLGGSKLNIYGNPGLSGSTSSSGGGGFAEVW